MRPADSAMPARPTTSADSIRARPARVGHVRVREHELDLAGTARGPPTPPRRGPRVLDARVEVAEARDPAQHVACLQRVTELAVAPSALVLGRERVLDPVGDVALVRARLEQLGLRIRRQRVGEAKRPRVLLSGLAVRAELGRTSCGCRRELEHGVCVAGQFGVVGEPRRIRGPVRAERCQHAFVQGDRLRGARVLPRPRAGELVPERDRACPALEHTGREALVHARGGSSSTCSSRPSSPGHRSRPRRRAPSARPR